MTLFVYEYLSVYNMGHKKFPLKKTIVQIKFFVSCPCPFRGTNFCVFLIIIVWVI